MPEKAMSDGLQPPKTGAFRAVRGLGKEIVRRIKNVYIEGNPQMLFHSDPLPHEIHETWPTDRSRRGFKTFETWVEGLDAIEFGGHSHLAIPESRWPSWLRDGCPAAKVKIGAFGSVNDIAKYPEWDENVRKRKKLGVPGGMPYDYKDAKNFFRRWRGSGWQAALTHWTCYLHIAFFWAMFGVFQSSNRDFVTEGFSRTVQNLVFFLITFYTGQVLGRYLGRWQDLMAMNGAIGHGGMKACANLKAEYAYNMVRLMNAYFQVYFRLTSGPRGMSPRAWWYLIQNGYLTESEVAVLSERGKPGIVLYTWTMQLLRTATDQGQCDSVQAARIEFEFTRARGLSAKQAAQQLLPFPFPYFHVFTMMVHVYLIGFSLNQASNTALVFNQNRDPDEFDLTQDFEIPPAGRYIREMISTHVVIILIMAIWRVDVWLSDPFGTDAVDYDLGFDIEFQLVEAKVMLQVAHDAQYGIKPSQAKPVVLHVIKESSSHTDSAHASAVPAGGGRRNLGNAAGGGSSASPPQAPADGEEICINLDPHPVDRYSTADGGAAPPDGEITQDLLKPQVIGRWIVGVGTPHLIGDSCCDWARAEKLD